MKRGLDHSMEFMPALPTAQSVTANLNHEMTGTVIDDATQRMAETLAETSDGAIDITVHSRDEMGRERDMFDLMQADAIEMGVTGSVIVSAVAPEYGVLDSPLTAHVLVKTQRAISGCGAGCASIAPEP